MFNLTIGQGLGRPAASSLIAFGLGTRWSLEVVVEEIGQGYWREEEKYEERRKRIRIRVVFAGRTVTKAYVVSAVVATILARLIRMRRLPALTGVVVEARKL